MGLFSSSKKTVVGSAAMHLMGVESLGNPIGDAVAEAVLTSGVPHASVHDITGNIISTNLNGFSLKVDRAYDYARDHYKLGLPSGERLNLPSLATSDIVPYILAEIGYPYNIVLTDYEYAVFTPMLAISAFLKNTRGYDAYTDSVLNWPPGTVYTAYWGENTSQYPRRVGIDSVTVMEDGITALVTYRKYITRPTSKRLWDAAKYSWYWQIVTEEVTDGTVTEQVAIPGAFPGMVWEDSCLFVLYRKENAQGQLQPEEYSWVYHLDTHVYPELHPDSEQDISTYLPVVPLRYNNEDLTTPRDTELYTTSKKLLELMGLNLGLLGNQLNKNPDIKDIDHAYVMFGVNLQADHIPSLYYLNAYFYLLGQNQRGDETSFLSALANPLQNDEPVNIVATNSFARVASKNENALKEYGLALDIQYDYIKSWVSNEVIGKPGHATKQISSYSVTANYSIPTTFSLLSGRHKLVLRAQINSYQVRTVEVYNLGTINWIYKDKANRVFLKDIVNNKDENGLIIPVQYQLAQQVLTNSQELNSFFADTLLLIINSVEHVKVKWYQKGFFKIIMVIIAVVIAIWTGQAWLVSMAAAYGAGGIMAVLVLLAKSIMISLAISYSVQFVVKNYGEKLGILGAIVLTIASMVASKGFGLVGTVSEGMMTAVQMMLQTSTALVSSANEFLIEKGKQIQEEFFSFKDTMSGLWDELEKTMDLLESKVDVDPLLFTKPEKFRIIPGESPTVFFQRCLGLADNSLFGVHDEIPNFFDMRLRHTKETPIDLHNLAY